MILPHQRNKVIIIGIFHLPNFEDSTAARTPSSDRAARAATLAVCRSPHGRYGFTSEGLGADDTVLVADLDLSVSNSPRPVSLLAVRSRRVVYRGSDYDPAEEVVSGSPFSPGYGSVGCIARRLFFFKKRMMPATAAKITAASSTACATFATVARACPRLCATCTNLAWCRQLQ